MNRNRKLITSLLGLFVLAATSQAANVFLKFNDAAGTTSFTGSTNWSNSAVPALGNSYFTTNAAGVGYQMRTPTGAGNYTFGGDSLTLCTNASSDSIALKGDGGTVITVNNLILAGGSVANGGNAAGVATTNTVVGSINVTAGSRLNSSAAGRAIVFVANITNGVSPITNQNAGAISLLGNNSAFTGKLVVITACTLRITNQFGLGGNPASFVADQLLLDNGTLSVSNSVNLNDANRGVTVAVGGASFDVGAGATLTLPNPIAGSGTISKRSAGTLILSGTNTAVGTLNIDTAQGSVGNDGIVKITSSGSLGSFTNINIRNQNAAISTLQLDGSAGGIVVTQSVTFNARGNTTPAIQNVAGSNTLSLAGLTLGTGGTAYPIQSDTNLLSITGVLPTVVPATGVRPLTFQGNGDISIPAIIQNGTGGATVAVTKASGSGRLTLSGNNTFSGGVNLNSGVTSFSVLANLGANTAFTFGGGTLQWAGANTEDISAIPGATFTFTFGGAGLDTAGNNVTFANAVGNFGAGGLTKLGGGTLALNGANSYTGTTVVSNGTLALAASTTLASTNLSPRGAGVLDVSAVSGFTLAANQTLSGSGTVLGSVADSSGANIAPGTSAGTLTVNGGLSLNGGGSLNFEIGTNTTTGSGSNDLLVVTGQLNIAAATTLNLSFLNSTPPIGNVYTILQYGTFAGSAANLTVPSGFIVTNNTGINAIQLITAHAPASLTWRGDGAVNAWDLTTTANWIHAGTNELFYTGDSVTFDNTGSNAPAVNLTAAMQPASVTVNATQDYTFTGSGIGSGSLTKSGGGALILDNNNSYPGATVVNAGTLQVGNAGTTGTLGSGPLTNNGTLAFNRSDAYTLASAVNGSGNVTDLGAGTTTLSGSISGNSVTMSGLGVLALTASNSYTGPTVISSGILFPRNAAALGSTASGTTATNGGQLYIDQNLNFPGESLTLGGSALRKGGGGVTTLGGTVALVADTTINIDGNATLNLTNAAGINGSAVNANLTLGGNGGSVGSISGPVALGAGALTVNSGGSWALNSTGGFSGGTTLASGVIGFNATNALGTGNISATASGRIVIATGLNFTNAVVASAVAPGIATGFLMANDNVLGTVTTVSGPLVINANSANGGHFVGPATSGYLNVSGSVTFGGAGTILLIRSGNVRFSGVGSGYAEIQIRANTTSLGLDNGVATNAVMDIAGNGSTTVPTYFDLNGFNQQLAGLRNLVGPANIAVVTNSSGTPKTLTLDPGTGNTYSFGGSVAGSLSLTLKSGTQVFTGTNNYSGSTTVSGGLLELAAATLATNSTVSVAGGAVLQLDFAGVTNRVGSLVLNGVSQAPGVYDSTTGSPYITGPGSLLVPSSVATNPTNITTSVSGTTLTLTWPADHTGWRLQVQTNSLSTGLSGNWSDVPGSTAVNTVNTTINPANGAVFYRMVYP